jgi:hypothetical protein
MLVIIAGPDRLCIFAKLCAGCAFGIIVPLIAILFFYLFIFSGCAAQRGLWPPVALQPSAGYGLLVTRGFLTTHNDAPQSVGLLWTSDELVAETST